jgi:uncharacterized protein YbjT (DUF2867 family)
LEILKGKKVALLVGATGLVGGYCLDFLLEHGAYRKVVVFSRRKLKKEHPKLEQHKVDFDRLADYRDLFRGDDLFCCLGTTMRKAGSKAAFYKVDFTYTHDAARLAVENGVKQFLLVSSVGADVDSLFFYSRVKGEIEAAVEKLPFWATHIFRPSVLLGSRNENRWGEEIAARIASGIDALTGGLLTKYRPIEADVVAKAMVNAAQQLKSGFHVYPSQFLQQLANEEEGRALLE